MNPTDWREQDGRDGHGHWRTMLIGVQAATEDGTVVLKISGPFIPMLLMFRRIGNGFTPCSRVIAKMKFKSPHALVARALTRWTSARSCWFQARAAP